jgi:hypothetical protein
MPPLLFIVVRPDDPPVFVARAPAVAPALPASALLPLLFPFAAVSGFALSFELGLSPPQAARHKSIHKPGAIA